MVVSEIGKDIGKRRREKGDCNKTHFFKLWYGDKMKKVSSFESIILKFSKDIGRKLIYSTEVCESHVFSDVMT